MNEDPIQSESTLLCFRPHFPHLFMGTSRAPISRCSPSKKRLHVTERDRTKNETHPHKPNKARKLEQHFLTKCETDRLPVCAFGDREGRGTLSYFHCEQEEEIPPGNKNDSHSTDRRRICRFRNNGEVDERARTNENVLISIAGAA